MEIVQRGKLKKFMLKHADARKATEKWIGEVIVSDWKNTMDIKRVNADASFLSDDTVVFNIRGNNYRFVVVVVYVAGKVLIEFAGTHAEYDKLNLR